MYDIRLTSWHWQCGLYLFWYYRRASLEFAALVVSSFIYISLPLSIAKPRFPVRHFSSTWDKQMTVLSRPVQMSPVDINFLCQVHDVDRFQLDWSWIDIRSRCLRVKHSASAKRRGQNPSTYILVPPNLDFLLRDRFRLLKLTPSFSFLISKRYIGFAQLVDDNSSPPNLGLASTSYSATWSNWYSRLAALHNFAVPPYAVAKLLR